MRIVVASLAAVVVLASAGCTSPNGAGARDGGRARGDANFDDAGPLFTDAGPNTPECNDGVHFCMSGYVCAAVMGVPRCVPDPNPAPPGDGTRCGDCPAPGECRMGICVQPTPGGGICEFDSACTTGQFCISGRCTPDPRLPVPCTDPSMCAPGFVCVMGTCQCVHSSDCPIGLACESGVCVTGPGGNCIRDADCMASEVCEAGMCRPRTVCDIAAPDLSGSWPTMHSTLRLREALPGWLDSLLRGISGPLLFLAGDTACIDFGLPGWVEDAICAAIAPYVGDALPHWAPPLFRAIAHLNDVLNTWEIDEHMSLTRGTVADTYRGTHTWDRISFVYAGRTITGDPTTVFDWMFTPSDFNAELVCGVFNVERHSVHLSVGAVIAWLVDAVIEEASSGMYTSLMDALGALATDFCSGLAAAADSSIDYPGVGATVNRVCQAGLSGLISTAVSTIRDARFGIDPITLRGTAQIGGPNSLVMGHWDGTLVGSDFTGDWQAMRP
jgi:hypothetical protein